MKNLFNPLQAVADYRAGHISSRGLLIRKVIFIAFLFAFAIGLLLPSPYPIYDIVSTVGYLSIYIGVPFYLNKKIDGKDFVSRFAVVHTPIFIDVMIMLFIAAFVGGFFVATKDISSAMVSMPDSFFLSLDLVADIFSVFLVILAFKKFR